MAGSHCVMCNAIEAIISLSCHLEKYEPDECCYALPLACRRDGPYYKGRIRSGMTALLLYCSTAEGRKEARYRDDYSSNK
jgi:hypothetical protein